MLQAKGILKSFGALNVLKGISLDVRTGEVVSLIGASGSGKSTFLRCLNLLEVPDGGELSVEGMSFDFSARRLRVRDGRLCALRAEVGMVFQHFNLFPHMTALANVSEGPVHVKGMSRAEATEMSRDLLAKVGLADKAASYPAQLSGGQKQRVAIARALAMAPKAILFDEVTSALDPELVGEVLTVLRSLANDGMTMILVTHEMAFAADISDRVGFMHDGTLAELGPPDQVLRNSPNPRLRAFLERYHQNHA